MECRAGQNQQGIIERNSTETTSGNAQDNTRHIFRSLVSPCSFPANEAETPRRTLPWKSHWKRSPICSCSLRRPGKRAMCRLTVFRLPQSDLSFPMCLHCNTESLWIFGSQVDDHRNNLREIVNGIADAGAFAKDHNAALLLLRPENVCRLVLR